MLFITFEQFFFSQVLRKCMGKPLPDGNPCQLSSVCLSVGRPYSLGMIHPPSGPDGVHICCSLRYFVQPRGGGGIALCLLLAPNPAGEGRTHRPEGYRLSDCRKTANAKEAKANALHTRWLRRGAEVTAIYPTGGSWWTSSVEVEEKETPSCICELQCKQKLMVN